MPVELSAATLSDILQELAGQQLQVETEVFSHGYLPLAYSARCMTARYHQLPKDNCQFICREYPQGLPARSQEGEQIGRASCREGGWIPVAGADRAKRL